MKKQRIIGLFVVIVCVALLFGLVACNVNPTPDDPTPTPSPVEKKFEVTGGDELTIGQDSVVTDEQLLAGISAKYGDDAVSAYVADKSALDVAVIGSYQVVIGFKDAQGEIIKNDDGENQTLSRKINIVENYYADVVITGNTELSFDEGAEVSDEALLAGVSAGEGFTVYIKDRSSVNNAKIGEYQVVLGVKKDGKIVKSNATTEVTADRKVIVTAHPINITFYCNDEVTIKNVYIELNTTQTDDEIERAMLAGIAAKDDDFAEYSVQLVGKGSFDKAVAGEYAVTIGAFSDGEAVKDANGDAYTLERKIIVKAFEKLTTPQNVAVGTDDKCGNIVFNAVTGAESYTIKVVALEAEATAEKVCEIVSTSNEVSLGFVSLNTGDYTVYVMASAEGCKDSDYSSALNITYTKIQEFLAEDIAKFDNADHGIASLENGIAKITTPQDGWGKAASKSFDLNYSLNPVLSLDIYNVDNAYFASINVNDDSEIGITGDVRDNKPVTKKIPSGSFSGKVSAKLIVGPTGGGPSVYLHAARIFALNNYVAPVVGQKLATPANLGVGADGASISWTGDALCENFQVVIAKRGEETAFVTTTTDKLSYTVVSLAKGDYTIKVKAIGDGTTTLDSDEATWDFSIKEYANYNAEQVGNFTGAGWEASSTVNYDAATGYATINYDGSRDYGAVGNAAVTIDLSKKPVVVMEDVTITTGWLARAFFGSSSIITMQSDTPCATPVHYDYLIRKTWINVDNNPIPGNSGSASAPAGTGAYRFLMGFVGGTSSRVQLKGMRIVYIEEYSDATATKLDTPSNFAVGSDGSSISYSSSALQHQYTIYKYGTEEVAMSGIAEGSSITVAKLSAGNYTLKVNGKGDGESTLDSDVATYSFTITDIENYSAQDIVDSTKFKCRDGSVTAKLSEDGKAVISNNSEWGVWAPITGVDINLADKVVIVVDGLTLTNKCWLSRSYATADGTTKTVVMQNDTDGTWENQTIIKRTWVNVDGNKIDANTGSSDAPSGTVNYAFGIGVNGTGIVEVQSIRLVKVTAYVEA